MLEFFLRKMKSKFFLIFKFETLITNIFLYRLEAEVVPSLLDLHQVGTFVQIHEMQDLGDRLRLVVMAHRRIRIMGQIYEDITEGPEGLIYFKYLHTLINRD